MSSRSDVHRPLLLPVVAALAASCGEPPAPETADAPRLRQAENGTDIDHLRALGYAGFSENEVAPDEPVVTIRDPSRCAPGYDLITVRNLTAAQLIDRQGRVLREWRDDGSYHWSNAELLPNGDLLVPGSLLPMGSGRHYVLRLDWDGNEIWRRELPAHHDVELTSGGQYVALTYRLRRIPEINRRFDVKDNGIALLDEDGDLVEERSLYDLLATKPALFRFQRVKPEHKESGSVVDLLHANSVEFLRTLDEVGDHPLYAPSNVLVSFRHQDTVAIFDWDAGELLWAWGQGEISGQHDATLLDSGNVLLFDNGLGREQSRIVEVDPRTDAIVWEFPSTEAGAFYSRTKGSAQRLANGNTLVADSDAGEAFEVTSEGEEVWRFRNPNTNAKGQRASIVRIKRYPAELVEALLSR